MEPVNRFCLNEAGQDLVEYSLLLVFIVLATLAIMTQTGSAVTPVWTAGNAVVQNAAAATS